MRVRRDASVDSPQPLIIDLGGDTAWRYIQFEVQYNIALEQLDAAGLPDDASYEMHEDYILWHHWADVVRKVTLDITALRDIAQEGLPGGTAADEGE